MRKLILALTIAAVVSPAIAQPATPSFVPTRPDHDISDGIDSDF
jgi:hypothetical protein